ncbi:MAG TPA: tetratricopeptide repeat protein [Gemmatimonadales bacterium]|nr:tetratricopeptide repeat protein [Gemmatimonadales bacterium]
MLCLCLLAFASAAREASGLQLEQLQAQTRADSNDPVAHFNLASALFKAGHYREAEQPLLLALSIDPQYAPALLLLSRNNEAQTSGRIAVVARQRRIFFVRVDPLADENARLRRRAFLIDPLLEVGPPNREALPVAWRGTLGLALYHYDRQEWQDAITGFQAVIDRTTHPRDSTAVPPVALWFRARCALQVGDYDSAIRYFQWLLAVRMQDSASERLWNPFAGEELRYVLAYVYQQARRWDEAVRRYQEVAQGNLGLDAAHTHLAEIYEAQERWAEAVEERVRALNANPDATSLTLNLGSTLVTAGRYAQAEPVLERYGAQYPRDARVFYLLGVARMGFGNAAGARDALTTYVALAPSRYEAQVRDAKQRLTTLTAGQTK